MSRWPHFLYLCSAGRYGLKTHAFIFPAVKLSRSLIQRVSCDEVLNDITQITFHLTSAYDLINTHIYTSCHQALVLLLGTLVVLGI